MTIPTLGEELAAARAQGGLVFRLQLGGELLRVTGADAPAWLQANLSQDLEPLTPGHGARSLLLDAKAAVLADMVVLRTREGFLLVADADPGRPLAEELERRVFRENVQLRSLEGAAEQLSLGGTGAADFLRERLSVDALPVALHAHAEAELAGWPVRVLRSRSLGVPGWDLLFDPSCGPQDPAAAAQGEGAAGALRGLFLALDAAGARRLSAQSVEALRLAAGQLRREPDLQRVLPQEAGLLPEAVSVAKGCYPGQEVVMRQHSRGKPRWRPQLVAGEGDPPSPGSAVEDAEGASAGWVSSAAHVPPPAAPGFLALVFVKAERPREGALRLRAEGEAPARPLELREPLPFPLSP
ncbi:MAG: hypothetical protein H6693_11375 [Candidatus Latescibacteria bacterium]|nr:hypothetical protein [Candidatus Latescibacterota bacterium]MCB9516785.1 hypothetical protein [Candidatus Latescibacterota bacterium]